MRDGDPAVLAALASRRGPAVLAFAGQVCEPNYVVRAAADAFARFRALVADPAQDTKVHPDALLLRCARRAALDLARPGPELGCGPAVELLAARAERTIDARDASLLNRHLETCDHCRDLGDRLDAADRAYRESEDAALDSGTLAPMVAALAAAAPVAAAPAPAVPREPAPAPAPAPAPEPEPEPEAEPEAAADPEPEVDVEAGPEPEPVVAGEIVDAELVEPPAEEAAADEPVEAVVAEPAPVPEAEPESDLEAEIPLGTKRLTGAPSAYYELPPLPPRDRRRRAQQAARGAASLAGLAREAARRRFDRRPERAPEPPATELPPQPEPEPEPVTRSWAKIESIEFPQVPEPEDGHEPPIPNEPELEQTAARAAARHYRRLRHKRQREMALPADGRPPRLTRPERNRGPHLPLSAHGPRDLALPAGLVVLAVLVIMAVSGVFGGGSETPATGTSAAVPAEVTLVMQSATALSLADAERIAERRAP